jgi:hypothetical protein
MMKTFKQYINEQFTHPSDVPRDFALIIYKIMHNQADFKDWEEFDNHAKKQGIENTLTWIRKILEVNPVEDIEKEIKWFEKELSKGTN